MRIGEAKKKIREMLKYILDVNDVDVIEGYAGTFDDILKSYAKANAIGFAEHQFFELLENGIEEIRFKTDIKAKTLDEFYDEWVYE